MEPASKQDPATTCYRFQDSNILLLSLYLSFLLMFRSVDFMLIFYVVMYQRAYAGMGIMYLNARQVRLFHIVL